jgi:hypothetical protein
MITAKAKKRGGSLRRSRAVSKNQLATNTAAKSNIERLSVIPDDAAAADAEPTRQKDADLINVSFECFSECFSAIIAPPDKVP